LLLKGQWEADIRTHGITDTVVETYQAASTESANSEAGKYHELVVFDEVHRIAAPVIRRVACLDYKYSLGLSASPFREDGNEAQIYALTGKPVFCDWGQYFAEVDVVRPRIKIVVCETEGERTAHACWLATRPNRAGRTLLFVEHIKMGEYLSASLRAPFYHAKNQPPGGDIFTTTEYWRQLTGKPVDTVILSRIGDEGLKIDGLRRVIVVESLGDSRRQEIQRLGRLLANGTESEYVMLLTREERITQSKKMDEILSLEGFVIEESVLERML
jgi:DNA excision repair protein ERCC-3